MDTLTVAVGAAACGSSPVMPYIGERADGREFTRLAALYLTAALLRCDFDVLGPLTVGDDARDAVMRINRHTADGAVILSLGAFGSRKSFNGVHGAVARYADGKPERHRVFCEDICAALLGYMPCATGLSERVWQATVCPTAVVDAGYLTDFDEAKLSLDPDHALAVAEHIAMGVCEHYGYAYVRRDDITAYPMLCAAATGKRGRKIKMLQALLAANDYPIETDGIFGKATDSAVRAFATNNGATGGVDAALWRELLLLNRKPLELGSKKCGVLYVKRKLRAKLYPCPPCDELDGETLSAVNAFLRDVKSDVVCTEATGVDERALAELSRIGGGKPRLF